MGDDREEIPLKAFTIKVADIKPEESVKNLSGAIIARTGRKGTITGSKITQGEIVLVPRANKNFSVNYNGVRYNVSKGDIVPKILMTNNTNFSSNINFEPMQLSVTDERKELIYLPFDNSDQIRMALGETKSTKGFTEKMAKLINVAKEKATEDGIKWNEQMWKRVNELFGIKTSVISQGRPTNPYKEAENQLNNLNTPKKTSSPATSTEKRKENAKAGLKGF
jgi:hypothetical protein